MRNLNFYDRRHRMEFLCSRANKAITRIEEILNRKLTNEEIATALAEGSTFLIKELKNLFPDAITKTQEGDSLDLRLLPNRHAEFLIPELNEVTQEIEFQTEIMDGIIVISTEEVDKYVMSNAGIF